MTLEEIHIKIRDHLLQQGEQAIVEKMCVYRSQTEDGRTLMCAAGCLIKNEHYNSTLEGQTAFEGNVHYALVDSGVPETEEAMSFIGEWQNVHDSHGEVQAFLTAVEGVSTQLPWAEYITACAIKLEATFNLKVPA